MYNQQTLFLYTVILFHFASLDVSFPGALLESLPNCSLTAVTVGVNTVYIIYDLYFLVVFWCLT